MGIAESFANFVCEVDYDSLDEKVISAAKNCILDTFGVSIAGLQEQSSRLILDLVSTQAESDESTIIGTNRKYQP
jgi:2-methylcitrate dehydratase PrpD